MSCDIRPIMPRALNTRPTIRNREARIGALSVRNGLLMAG
jgi:hypothetical protein